ncbi:hypothetical protein BGX38DRAFT_285181 [Terfezia claveryi]|nr:hypothetical protein BGX38DRAFT_285181 [Terfezia claveryi]
MSGAMPLIDGLVTSNTLTPGTLDEGLSLLSLRPEGRWRNEANRIAPLTALLAGGGGVREQPSEYDLAYLPYKMPVPAFQGLQTHGSRVNAHSAVHPQWYICTLIPEPYSSILTTMSLNRLRQVILICICIPSAVSSVCEYPLLTLPMHSAMLTWEMPALAANSSSLPGLGRTDLTVCLSAHLYDHPESNVNSSRT